MCHIIPRYKEFIQEAKKIINENTPCSLTYFLKDVEKVTKEKFVFGKRKIKQFYKKYQQEIEIINRHTNLEKFLVEQLYGREEKGDLEETINYFYEYIYKNRVHLDQILIVLETMKILGFRHIELDETTDFTKKEYIVSSEPKENYGREIAYFENLERIQTSDKEIIKYKINSSHYKIRLGYSEIDYRYRKDTTIYVNSLIFDPSLLPAYPCVAEDLFKEIVSLKEEKQEKIPKYADDSITLLKWKKSLEKSKNILTFPNERKDALLQMELKILQIEQEQDKERKK